MIARAFSKRRAGFAMLAVLAPIAGCSLATISGPEPTNNTCVSSDECGSDASCVSLGTGRACVATHTDLGQVILEVRPSADANGNTVSHVFTDKLTLSGDFAGGAMPSVDLTVPANVTFKGELFAGDPLPPPNDSCTAADGSVPVKVELRSVSPYAAFSNTYATTAKLIDGGYSYTLPVPAGPYDVYLSPDELDAGCAAKQLPPRLIPAVDVSTNVDFSSSMDSISRLSGSILLPPNVDVSGWHLEVVDSKYGLVISDSEVLPDAMGAASIPILGPGDDPLGLRFYYTGSPVVRLRDPDGKLIVHWSLPALDVDGDDNVDLDLRDLVANPVSLQADVIDGDARGVPAFVTIESEALTGQVNGIPSFRVAVETDADGQLSVDLVPGDYKVYVSPKTSPDLAGTVDTWHIDASTLGYGKTFQLKARPTLSGGVVTPGGKPLDSVPIVVVASDLDAQKYFDQAIKTSTSFSGDSSDATDESGRFSFLVDPGTIDFSVQPTASTLFPWVVVPQLLVADSDTKPIVDMGTLDVGAPVIVGGSVSSAEAVVPAAVVRAYLPLPSSDPKAAIKVVQIGETVTDDSGKFSLPLPASISLGSTMPSPN